MTSSAHEGKTVVFVDAIKLRHEGVIVGQSQDGETQYVRSTNLRLPPVVRAQEWHFTIRTEALDQHLI